MAKHKIDQIDIVVDCYNESERYSAWICYLEDKLEFPFRARCVATRKSSPLKSGEKVEIVSMLDEDCDEPSEIFVQARWQGRELGLPLAQLEGIGVSNQTAEAIADWHYWRAHGHSF
jgi:Calcium binding